MVRTSKKANGNETSKNDKKNKDNSLYWIIGVALFLILVLILYPTISKKMNTFKYEGLSFSKINYAGVDVYYYYYYFNNKEGGVTKHNIYLRTDPRKNEIPVEGDISFLSNSKTVYITVNYSGFGECSDKLISVMTLSGFIVGNQYPVMGAYAVKSEAKKNNGTYVVCGNKVSNMVLYMTWGNETKISKNKNCYTFSVSRCEDLLPIVEKFEIQSILDAKDAQSKTYQGSQNYYAALPQTNGANITVNETATRADLESEKDPNESI